MKQKSITHSPVGAVWLSVLLAVAGISAHAQTYSVNWYKVSGGGGTGTNSQFTISGTIGQPEAGGAMVNSQYAVTGGFWSIISTVPTLGAPSLTIVTNGPNSLKVFWLDPAVNTYTLQQSANLSSPSWTTSAFTINSANGTNSITLTPPVGNLFFRLKH